MQILRLCQHRDPQLPIQEPRELMTTTAADVTTKATGAVQNISLSAPDGTIISFEINFNPSAINCKIPSIFPAYSGPILNCILARNLRSIKIVAPARRAA